MADWPADVVCRMNDEFPKDIQCADNLYGAGIRVVSGRVKNFFIAEGLDSLEFLSVMIVNHKGRNVDDDYFIVNPSYTIDCIDIQSSEVKWNKIKSDLISSCKSLVLNAELVPESEVVFRPKYLPTVILIRADLAKKLTDASFTGFIFRDPLKYKGI